MKAYVLGLLLSAMGAMFSFTFQQSESAPNVDTEQVPTDKAFFKAQLSHLHHLDPIDIKDVPAIYPLTETEHVHVGSPYGMRKHPVHKIIKMHKGQDFAAPTGTPVIATADGTILKATAVVDSSGYGKHLVVGHDEVFQDEKYSTLYAHLSKVLVKVGERVARGDTIGYSGNTGTSTNPHLHYEVIRNGEAVDPMDYLM